MSNIVADADKPRRASIGKKLRFEVFKRDKFKCQYCGSMAPDVVLHVDHIHPVAAGGENDILNLITSCAACNFGKGARPLSDDSEISRQKVQLRELADRREQLSALLEWRETLKGLDAEALGAAISEWECQVAPFTLTETGARSLQTLVSRFGLDAVLRAIDKAVHVYVKYDADGPILDTVNLAFAKLGGTSYFNANPDHREKRCLAYVRGILLNRHNYCNSKRLYQLGKEALALGVLEAEIKEMAIRSASWTEFNDELQEVIWIAETAPRVMAEQEE